jgi:peptidoglycan/LPS O-acetylase OafA/YrhL
MNPLSYRREIDGLRTVAVLPVILFHAGVSVFPGGFVGVDIFFVISGYLITTIILREIEEGQFSIIDFYERRARRILPALFLVMLCCLPFAWFKMLPFQLEAFGKSLIAVVLFISNILFWREDNYFRAASEEKPLLHTWSLAVEEQYYIFFPIFLVLLWRFGPRAVAPTIFAAVVFSLAAAEWGARNMPSASFYLIPTRAWELLVGSLTACWMIRRPRIDGLPAEIGGGVGLALIG